jgi:hypothetical protein
MPVRKPSAALVLTLAACTPGIVLHGQPVDSARIRVSPTEVGLSGAKLSVKLVVENSSETTLVIRPDQIVVRLSTGQVVTRAAGKPYGEGIWGSYYGGGGWVTHDPDVLPPGTRRAVDVEYEELGFVWADFPSVQVDFDGAVTRDGQPVVLPALVVSR